MPKDIISLGICLGASTVSIVKLSTPFGNRWPADKESEHSQKPCIIDYKVHPHDGNPKKTLSMALQSFEIERDDKISATGRKFRDMLNMTTLTEAEAVEYAYQYVKPDETEVPAIVSAGGETFMVYLLNQSGKISGVMTGNKCASGTGEFFMQQLRRMNVTVDTAARWASDTKPYRVSGRCSVFCKSDCTHATNKGIPKENVTAGLCQMMAHKILELLKKVTRKNIIITGGSTLNHMMIEHLEKEIDNLIVPEQAPFFEALGAALWGFHHETIAFDGLETLFRPDKKVFHTLAPLKEFEDKVVFTQVKKKTVQKGDECILGLDVGSTTTKAVLMRANDNAILASVYLRTNGDPIKAARACYEAILNQINEHIPLDDLTILGIGICGSGRQIAGLHAGTKGVINEITAHATAAVFFDPQVDTIFEIGGQDAKYTYIVNGTPSDYAMNEACSAGTGSFLEESAFETLNLKMTEIADVALKGEHPPNFNDQCAAFIASDIKNAIHEGVSQEDIVAGLVYSICMNYCNRVKGNRPYGEKVFMQGGVCYNRAVPLAMAALLDKSIIVPPEPGLMGAFGAALEIKHRIGKGMMDAQRFDLNVLIDRKVQYRSPFYCKGGKSKCDRNCKIERIVFGDETFPFGGACNMYNTLQSTCNKISGESDGVKIRHDKVFAVPHQTVPSPYKGRIGLNRSFLTHTYYPLFSNFFSQLSYETVLPDTPTQEGIDSRNASFCYPVELAHGFFHDLVSSKEKLDYLFLPHFRAIPSQISNTASELCPLVQGESFYLKTTFKEYIQKREAKGMKMFSPLIDLNTGLEDIHTALIETALAMGVKKREAKKALDHAISCQKDFFKSLSETGKTFLEQIENDPSAYGIVIFGRPYNAFAPEAHMGIPKKFSSRGILTLPMDFLPSLDLPAKEHMYWGMGQLILKTARFVASHPQLYGVYITNFSCGPDSFVINYFRSIMKDKPSLTLELDSHTADAGLETRIEAFLDIIHSNLKRQQQPIKIKEDDTVIPSDIFFKDSTGFIQTSDQRTLKLTDPNVTLLFPSMGKLSSEALSAVFKGEGFHSKAHPPSDEKVLKIGRGNTLCKECLPLILTAGTLINYLQNERKKDEVVIYFMPTSSGPCRFGQYSVFMKDLVKRLKFKDVAIFSLNSDNAYGGLKPEFHRKSYRGMVIADVFEDIRAMLLANAVNKDEAIRIFNDLWVEMLTAIQKDEINNLKYWLTKSSQILKEIPLKKPAGCVPQIALIGEIFVRRDGISRQYITEYLADKGFAVTCAPISEWVQYTNYHVLKGYGAKKESLTGKMKLMMKQKIMRDDERMVKSILSKSGLISNRLIDIPSIINTAKPYVSPHLGGEAILTVGLAIEEIISHTCGVISIGPFGCMPNRLSESILNDIMKTSIKQNGDEKYKKLRTILSDDDPLPFLSIESDGSAFPQLINSKLETFCLSAKRLHEKVFSLMFN